MRMGSICCVRGGGGWGRGCAHLHTPIWWMHGKIRLRRASSRLSCASLVPALVLVSSTGRGKGEWACLVHQDPRERRSPGKCSIHGSLCRIFPVCPKLVWNVSHHHPIILAGKSQPGLNRGGGPGSFKGLVCRNLYFLGGTWDDGIPGPFLLKNRSRAAP